MPRRFVVTAFTLLLVLALTLPVQAKTVKTSFRIFDPVILAGTELEPGEYRLVADESTVTIYRDREKVVETEANWVEGEKRDRTSIVTNGREVREIRIGGQKRHLQFNK